MNSPIVESTMSPLKIYDGRNCDQMFNPFFNPPKVRRKETKCFVDYNKSMILPNKTNIDCTEKIWNNFTARN